MWSSKGRINSRRAALALLLSASLGACGFTPVLKEGSASRALLGTIDVDIIEGRNHYEYRRALLDQLSRPNGDAIYRLSYKMTVDETALSVSTTADIERFNLIGEVEFELRVRATDDLIYQDKIRASAGYSATATAYPTQVAERDAIARLSRSLAELTFQRLLLNSERIIP